MIKKMIATLLCVTILCFSGAIQSQASEIQGENVFVNGVEYNVTVDDDTKNVTVTTVGLEKNSKMVLTPNGDAEINLVTENLEVQELTLKINELTDDDVDVVVEENNKIIEEFESPVDLQPDEYVGQASIAAGGTIIVVGSLLTALLYATLAVVIAGATCYAISRIINTVKNTNYYYRAYRKFNTVFINPKAITASQATSILKSADTYTFFSSNARSAVFNIGRGVTPSEHHKKLLSVGTFFCHYHTGNRTGGHSFYGLPV